MEPEIRAGIAERDLLYIGGAWVEPAGHERLAVVDPAREKAFGHAPAGTASDVDRAVRAAREASVSWAATDPAARADALSAIADGIERRVEEIAALITREMGMPLAQSRMFQAGLAALDFRTAAGVATTIDWEEPLGNSLLVRDPVGVVGCITPWNYPLHQLAAKAAAAIAAGCTVVIKPSELTPLDALMLAEICEEVGLPAGVFNIVTGTGPTVGEALVTHPGVDMISFTGSTRAGARVQELAARRVKPVALELGGKSASVLLDDADLDAAVTAGVQGCFINSGQTCSALTRMVVPRRLLDEVEQRIVALVDDVRVGDPFDPETTLGPLAGPAQRDRVAGFVDGALDAGTRLLAGGPSAASGLPKTGFYAPPTVFTDVAPDSTLAQEEVFGPVLAVISYDGGDEEAVALANDSDYGLSGAVWSADPARALAAARRIRTGQVSVNNAAYNPLAPFGGVKRSGHGRELGPHGIIEFTTLKAIQQ
ncbi:aldehyde dehydrogenase family protein [Streptomyces sp. NPDC056390]|uniref:aldehyde dehydrogenase family protein n=1 Tax=Streptomyces sp. NPDC056390 TaxID=3345806 RepID=UPI0035D84BEC